MKAEQNESQKRKPLDVADVSVGLQKPLFTGSDHVFQDVNGLSLTVSYFAAINIFQQS
jgi:hypothetical protein